MEPTIEIFTFETETLITDDCTLNPQHYSPFLVNPKS